MLCLSFAFVFMPTVSSSFWMLTVLAVEIYLVMYILMFLSGIILRYTHKDTVRHFRIPFGNVGMWIVSILGLIGCLFTLCIGFIPPSIFPSGDLLSFELTIGLGLALSCLFALILWQARKSRAAKR